MRKGFPSPQHPAHASGRPENAIATTKLLPYFPIYYNDNLWYRGWYHTREEDLALKSMPLDKLVELRNRIDATLASKVAGQRRALQSELSKLGRVQSNASRRIGARPGGVVAPKYRNPNNP